MKAFSRRMFLKGAVLAGAAAALTGCSMDINDWIAANGTDGCSVQLCGTVTDAGEVVSAMVIDLGKMVSVSGVDKDTFTVHAMNELGDIIAGTDIVSYGNYSIDRTIVDVKVEGGKITLYFDLSEGATLCYASSSRNYPGDLTYTITQNKPISISCPKGKVELGQFTGTYTCDNTVYNPETAKFKSVIKKGGINYQLYVPEGAKKLIVWFHGNGEGDMLRSKNNVAQMRANRGAVAWATDKAQKIFGGAAVMAFQAPDTWYYAQRDNLLNIAAKEIIEVIAKYDLDPNKVAVSGCSAGGYMTSRMLLAHPELFAVANINCPAYDVATARGGETPTDEELLKIQKNGVPVWLVQGATDGVVNTDQCSKRLFAALSHGNQVSDKRIGQRDPNNSAMHVWETADNKYKLSLYDTTEDGKICVAEDYDLDGKTTQVQYNNHWSWIYSLNNNPKAADGTHLWQWMASYM